MAETPLGAAPDSFVFSAEARKSGSWVEAVADVSGEVHVWIVEFLQPPLDCFCLHSSCEFNGLSILYCYSDWGLEYAEVRFAPAGI